MSQFKPEEHFLSKICTYLCGKQADAPKNENFSVISLSGQKRHKKLLGIENSNTKCFSIVDNHFQKVWKFFPKSQQVESRGGRFDRKIQLHIVSKTIFVWGCLQIISSH